MLGFTRCYWYNSENEPQIVIGPDWVFSLVKIGIINLMMVSAIRTYSWQDYEMTLKQLGFMIMFAENACFAAAVLANPGLARRSPDIHSKTYLNLVRNL